jgi:hypothetical protein
LDQVAAELGEAGADLCQFYEGFAAIAANTFDAGEFAFEVAQGSEAGAFFAQVPQGAAEEIVHFLVRVFRLAHLLDESTTVACQHHGVIIAAQALAVV